MQRLLDLLRTPWERETPYGKRRLGDEESSVTARKGERGCRERSLR